jgi:hypothetical protein
MTSSIDNKDPGSQRVFRLVLFGAVIGAVAALVYALVRRTQEPKR